MRMSMPACFCLPLHGVRAVAELKPAVGSSWGDEDADEPPPRRQSRGRIEASPLLAGRNHWRETPSTAPEPWAMWSPDGPGVVTSPAGPLHGVRAGAELKP